LDLSVRSLQKAESEYFANLVVWFISKGYDDIDASFPARILEAHFRGYDPFGYFTVRKTVLALDGPRALMGFVVAAEKRGGSVKFGPTIIDPKHQRGGLAGRLWELVEDIYRDKGKRKVYGTWPAWRVDVLKFASRMEWEIEALLREQYRPGQDEFVAGKFLLPSSPPLTTVQTWEGEGKTRDASFRLLKASDEAEFSDLMLSEMSKFYSEIDRHFVESILEATHRFSHGYDEKGKVVFIAESIRGGIIGCAIATPKRGGSVKLAPVIMKPLLTSIDIHVAFLEYIHSFFRERNHRKLYSLIPIADIDTVRATRQAGYVS